MKVNHVVPPGEYLEQAPAACREKLKGGLSTRCGSCGGGPLTICPYIQDYLRKKEEQ